MLTPSERIGAKLDTLVPTSRVARPDRAFRNRREFIEAFAGYDSCDAFVAFNISMEQEMNNSLIRLIAVLSVFGASLLSGCNTMEGAGRDVEAAGEKIQDVNCTGADAKNDSRCK